MNKKERYISGARRFEVTTSREKHGYITQEETGSPGCWPLSSPAVSALPWAFLPISARRRSQAAHLCTSHDVGPRRGSWLGSASRKQSKGGKRGGVSLPLYLRVSVLHPGQSLPAHR